MSRNKNDGRGRLGGRTAGTKDKVTQNLKSWVQQVIDNNRQQMELDLASLEPRDRLNFMEKLMAYCLPKATAETTEDSPASDVVEDTIRRLCFIHKSFPEKYKDDDTAESASQD